MTKTQRFYAVRNKKTGLLILGVKGVPRMYVKRQDAKNISFDSEYIDTIDIPIKKKGEK